jgi:LPXTG-site transpeptidase (sortase) family protein
MAFSILTTRASVPIYAAWIAGVFIGGVSMSLFLFFTSSVAQTVTETDVTDSAPLLVLEEALPVRLTIPAVNLNTTFADSVGINPDGSVAVPKTYEQVGWYKYGPTPGERGPAVILGHVDSVTGPAVFYDLKQVSPGDEVFIEREDGITAVFTVIEIEDLKQTQFPTKKVYDDLDYAGLRLITCTGDFSHFSQRYSHNLILYAKLTRLE